LCPQDYEIDFISLSYTRSVDDVVEARAFLDAVGLQNTKIFAKLESRQSLLNFKGILNEADGIIISRWACWGVQIAARGGGDCMVGGGDELDWL
jgi:pyruvate kinase